jgi:hypothetical protein
MREWETASPPFSRRRGSGDSSRYVPGFWDGPDWIPFLASSISEKMKISCYDELYVRSVGFSKPKNPSRRSEHIFIKKF